MKQQWKKRVDVFRYIYSTLINNDSDKEAKRKAFEEHDFLDNELKIIDYFIDNKIKVEQLVSSNLKPTWAIDRISLIDRAILYSAISEFFVTKMDKKIIIDQALTTAKFYTDNQSIKFINAILDKILINGNKN